MRQETSVVREDVVSFNLFYNFSSANKVLVTVKKVLKAKIFWESIDVLLCQRQM